MSGIVIERMGAEHVTEVHRIECELFGTPWSEGMFRQEVEHDASFSRPFVAVGGDGELIGYMINWFVSNEVHLLNIGVAPAHQRNGYARQMMDYLIDLSRRDGREYIILEVRESNNAARHLYDSLGFKRIGIRERYYEDSREDAVVMMLPLENPEADDA